MNDSRYNLNITSLVAWLVIPVVFVYALYVYLTSANEAQAYLSDINDVFTSIPQPNHTSDARSPSTICKANYCALIGFYKTETAKSEIIDFYSRVLNEEGWTLVENEVSQGMSLRTQIYCRDGLFSSVDISNQSWLDFSFSVFFDVQLLKKYPNCMNRVK